jgi:putative transposase
LFPSNRLRWPIQAVFWLEWGAGPAYALLVPSSLQRFQRSRQSHFVTFGCFHGRCLFAEPVNKLFFEQALERARTAFDVEIYGYVVMPDHVRLLMGEPRGGLLSEALKSLKQGVARRLVGKAEHFWQKRYYDFNVRDEEQFKEKLRYIHRNPVQGELCESPEDWEWSSFRHYATGVEGRVEIESEWTARKRERAAGRLCESVDVPHSSPKKA